jgi:hypothetical protein
MLNPYERMDDRIVGGFIRIAPLVSLSGFGSGFRGAQATWNNQY